MRCYYLNFTKNRFNNCYETAREKKRKAHLITSLYSNTKDRVFENYESQQTFNRHKKTTGK